MNAPHDPDAESYVIGAMLLNEKALADVLAELEPEGEQAFYLLSHGRIYRACRHLYRTREVCDVVTVSALLEQHGHGEDRERVHEAAATVPATRNVAHHARIVREQWLKRLVAQAAWDGHEQASNGTPSTEAAETMMKALLGIQAKAQRAGRGPTLLAELAQRLEERVKNPPADDGIQPPFPSFPRLKPSRLYVLAGYTKDGKTSVACQFAAKAASRGVPVGFVSIEMSEDQLFDRMVAGYGVPLGQVESGRILPPYQAAYRTALRELTPLRVEVIDDPSANAASIAPIQRARKYGLLIVDHLHRISLPGNPGDRRQRLEDEVRALVNLTLTEHVPILLLAQLSRSGTPGQPFPRPNPNMLRETAVIEQEAALVSFIYRRRDERNEPTDEAELIVALNRFGPPGNATLRFRPDLMRYEEVQL